MNDGHIIRMVFESSLFGLLFGAFTTIYVLGKVVFAHNRDNGDMGADRMLWGFTCFVVLALSMIPLYLVVRTLLTILF